MILHLNNFIISLIWIFQQKRYKNVLEVRTSWLWSICWCNLMGIARACSIRLVTISLLGKSNLQTCSWAIVQSTVTYLYTISEQGPSATTCWRKGGARCSTILIGDMILKTTKFILAIKTQNRLCHSSCTFCQNDKLGLFTTFQKHCCLEDHQDLSGFFFLQM